jgi:hypothetical protein
MIRRREFLKGGAVTGLVLGLVPWRTAEASPANRPSYDLSKKKFQALLNEHFNIQAPGFGELQVKLVGIEEGPKSEGLEQFRVIFRGGRTGALSPGLYTLRHLREGDLLLYLDPMENGRHRESYVATFSLFPPKMQSRPLN